MLDKIITTIQKKTKHKYSQKSMTMVVNLVAIIGIVLLLCVILSTVYFVVMRIYLNAHPETVAVQKTLQNYVPETKISVTPHWMLELMQTEESMLMISLFTERRFTEKEFEKLMELTCDTLGKHDTSYTSIMFFRYGKDANNPVNMTKLDERFNDMYAGNCEEPKEDPQAS